MNCEPSGSLFIFFFGDYMSVVVVSKTEIHEIVDGPRNWITFTFNPNDNGHFVAILVKCNEADGNFYRDIMHEASCDLGRIKRFLQYLARRGTDVIYVYLMPDGTREIMYYAPDSAHVIKNDAAIVRVDDSVDPVIMQRAMDKDKWIREQIGQPYNVANSIDHLISNGLVSTKHTVIKF
ncbi:hypothetical protein [Pseudomonas phage D6]|nr:hypothetical protein [Pseudomonas phage D6]